MYAPRSTLVIIELSNVGVAIVGFTSIITIGTVFLKSRKYIEDRVQEALSKDDVIQKISLLVKPDMIFDIHGAILSDRGASTYIQDKGIKFYYENAPDDGTPTEIHIYFSKHVKTAPLLTPINTDGIFIKTQRGELHTWIYKLEYYMTTEPENDPTFSRQYRLEIL
jgi:hypothetical protein